VIPIKNFQKLYEKNLLSLINLFKNYGGFVGLDIDIGN